MSKKRGPYKTYLTDPSIAIPRQTRYNWRKSEQSRNDSSPTHRNVQEDVEVDSFACASFFDGSLCSGAENEDDDVNAEMEVDSDPVTFDRDDTTSTLEEEGGVTGDTHSSLGPLLYEGAQISEETGVMLLLSLATRHKLSLSALGDTSPLLFQYRLPTNRFICY